MTEAQRAAFRILSSTPRERIRTHTAKAFNPRGPGKRLGAIPDALREELKALLLAGTKRAGIFKKLAMGEHLYQRILHDIQRRMDVGERRAIVADLSAKGIPERRIAAVIGISRTAVQDHKRAIQREAARDSDSRYADIPTL